MEIKIAGDSHGTKMIGLIEEIPAGLKIDEQKINDNLRRRRLGYGRGERMKIETDQVQVIAGTWRGITTGAPVVIEIENKAGNPINTNDQRHVPRPGHGDYTGWSKYRLTDLDIYTERNSARWTCVLTALGSIAEQFLDHFNIEIMSFVSSIGSVCVENSMFEEIQRNFDFYIQKRDASPVQCPFDNISEKMIEEINEKALKQDTTLGGSIKTFAINVQSGLGSYANVFNRVDSKIGKYFMSIPSVKGVFIGLEDVSLPGNKYHDPFVFQNGKITRTSNNAGGIEAGITNGDNIIVTTYFKPISTLAKPLDSINLETKENVKAPYIRSDSVILPAATVITECTLALILMEEIIDGFGNDNIELIKERYFSKYSKNS